MLEKNKFIVKKTIEKITNFIVPFLLNNLNIVIFIIKKQDKDTINENLIVKNKMEFSIIKAIFTLLFSRYVSSNSKP